MDIESAKGHKRIIDKLVAELNGAIERASHEGLRVDVDVLQIEHISRLHETPLITVKSFVVID